MSATGTARPRTGRRVVVVLLAVVAVLAAGDGLLWRWTEGELQTAFDDWAAGRRAQGWTVTTGLPWRSGWPLVAQITEPGLAVAARHPDLPGALNWTAERLTLRISLLHPRTLEIAIAGDQHLHINGVADLPFTADRFEAVVPLRPGLPARGGDLEVSQLRAGVAGAGVTLARLHMHGEFRPTAQQGEAWLALTGGFSDLVMPEHAWALGPRIGSAALDVTLTGPLPRAETPLARATAWRDGGGTLAVKRVTFAWGPLDLDGSATLALDEHMQPMGAGSARLTGYAATLDALVAGRMIGARAAIAAKAVLGLMAHTPADGGAPVVEVPLTLQGGALSVGRIPLGRMPELSWPDAAGPVIVPP